jgi:hypothetical protein
MRKRARGIRAGNCRYGIDEYKTESCSTYGHSTGARDRGGKSQAFEFRKQKRNFGILERARQGMLPLEPMRNAKKNRGRMVEEFQEVVFQVVDDKSAERRLYSRGYQAASDADDKVDPKHALVHSILVRWGAWVRNRGGGGGSGTVESTYERGRDGTPPSTAPQGPDPELVRMERALLRMPVERAGAGGMRWVSEGRCRVRVANVIESPGLTLRLLYAYGWQPVTICEALVPRCRLVAWAGHVGVQRSICRNVFMSL